MVNGNLIYTWSSGMPLSPGNFFAGSSGGESIFFSRKQSVYLGLFPGCYHAEVTCTQIFRGDHGFRTAKLRETEV